MQQREYVHIGPSRRWSGASITAGGACLPNTSMIRGLTSAAAVFSMKNTIGFKNNSATSSRGYDSKHTLWGRALPHMLR